MADYRRVGFLAILLLVIVRVSIGWHLLYEGLWKLNTQTTAEPWSAEPYLKNAQGPFKDHFRNLSGDPHDLKYLDYDTVLARWQGWADRFADHYELSKARRGSLKRILHGRDEFSADLEQLPDALKEKLVDKKTDDGVIKAFPGSLGKYIQYDEEAKKLVVSGKYHLTRRDYQNLIKLVDAEDIDPKAEGANPGEPLVAYLLALEKVYESAKRLSIKERLMVTLKGDPERAGKKVKIDGEVVEERAGDIEVFRNYLDKYQADEASADIDFELDHLGFHRNKVQQRKSDLIGPVKSLESELKWNATRMLTTEQLRKGPVPEPLTDIRFIDLSTMWGLAIIGCLLICGLLTRIAALAGGGLLLQFYLAYPPLPGYPPPPGPQHNLIVSQTLIEVFVLFAFVFLPSGRWFGIDAIIGWLFSGRRKKK